MLVTSQMGSGCAMDREHCALMLAPSLVMVCGSATTKQMSKCAFAHVSWTGENATSHSTWRSRIQLGWSAAYDILGVHEAYATSRAPCEALQVSCPCRSFEFECAEPTHLRPCTQPYACCCLHTALTRRLLPFEDPLREEEREYPSMPAPDFLRL